MLSALFACFLKKYLHVLFFLYAFISAKKKYLSIQLMWMTTLSRLRISCNRASHVSYKPIIALKPIHHYHLCSLPSISLNFQTLPTQLDLNPLFFFFSPPHSLFPKTYTQLAFIIKYYWSNFAPAKVLNSPGS